MTEGGVAGKVALVTGGASGFGWAAARGLASEGAHVMICGRRAGKLAFAVARIVRLQPLGDVFSTSCDVTEQASIDGLVETTLARFGRIDILVNNAAVILQASPLTEHTFAQIEQVLKTNLQGPMVLSGAVIPHMKKNNFGRIINVTSGLGWKALPGFAAYAASKAGLNSLTRNLATELAGWDILVNAIDPGVAKTELNPGAKNEPDKIIPGILKLAGLPSGGPSGRIFRKDGTTEVLLTQG